MCITIRGDLIGTLFRVLHQITLDPHLRFSFKLAELKNIYSILGASFEEN